MKTRILLSLFVLVVSVIPNACLVEQVIATVADSFPREHHQESQHHEEATPSHSHDEEGHEEDFCCDNELYLYIGAKTVIEFAATLQSNTFLNSVTSTKQTETYIEYQTYLHRLRQPLPSRGRDKYALTCLLHAPPYI